MLGAEAAGYPQVARKGADLHEEEGLLLIDLLEYLLCLLLSRRYCFDLTGLTMLHTLTANGQLSVRRSTTLESHVD